jgi:hypothetical protein
MCIVNLELWLAADKRAHADFVAACPVPALRLHRDL